jgi:hypothetical protein
MITFSRPVPSAVWADRILTAAPAAGAEDQGGLSRLGGRPGGGGHGQGQRVLCLVAGARRRGQAGAALGGRWSRANVSTCLPACVSVCPPKGLHALPLRCESVLPKPVLCEPVLPSLSVSSQ